MAAQTDRIERDVLIAAPVERVWDLITTAEHLGRWFGDAGAEIDLRPGGRLTLRWHDSGAVDGRVEVVEPPRRFAYRWQHSGDPAAELTPANSTFVDFTLAAEGGGTRVAVVESVFAALADPTRWRLLGTLADQGEGTATTLAAELPVSRPAVIKHLGVLDRAGLVRRRRAGREVRYRVEPERLDATARQIAAVAAAWDRRLAALKALAEEA